MIKVNGKIKEYENSVTIESLILQEGYEKDIVVVEVNEKIIKKNEYETYMLKDGDKVEILKFVGGG